MIPELKRALPQSILPAHCGWPHSQEISTPDLTVSQWGLQYLLSSVAKQLQPGCAQRFLSLSSITILSDFGLFLTVEPRFDSALAVRWEFLPLVSQHVACHWLLRTLPVRVSRPFFALNVTCCLSRPLDISAAL